MNRFFHATPRPVLISLAVILAALIVFAVLSPLLGGARDDVYAENIRLTDEISTVQKAMAQAKDDQAYVQENTAQFEALLKSDRLVPHTRRAAIMRLEEAARANGLTAFSYNIGAVAANSAEAVNNQPASNAYRVSIESIQLKVGAPVDGNVYRFLTDIADAFPGSAVLELMSLRRPEIVSAAALNDVSNGRDSKLVEGDIVMSWRTAQAVEKAEEGKGK